MVVRCLILPILVGKAPGLAGVIVLVALGGLLLVLPKGGGEENSSSRDLSGVVETYLVKNKHGT